MKRSDISGIVITFPILPGKVEAWRRFCQELAGSRRKQYEFSRQRLGITRETMALMETSFGATAVTTLEAADIAGALQLLIASDHSFDVWYRERLNELHGVNLAGFKEISRPLPVKRNLEVQFDWESDSDKTDDNFTDLKGKTRKEHHDERKNI